MKSHIIATVTAAILAAGVYIGSAQTPVLEKTGIKDTRATISGSIGRLTSNDDQNYHLLLLENTGGLDACVSIDLPENKHGKEAYMFMKFELEKANRQKHHVRIRAPKTNTANCYVPNELEIAIIGPHPEDIAALQAKVDKLQARSKSLQGKPGFNKALTEQREAYRELQAAQARDPIIADENGEQVIYHWQSK